MRIIVPYAPGGGTDTFTRLLANALSAELGQPVIVENRPGANGVVGSEMIARSDPDGHHLLVVVSTHVLNRYVMRSIPFDPISDFTPIMRLCRTVVVLVAGRQLPFDSVASMVAAARARPGSISLGHSEASTAYAGALLARMAGVEFLPVPYRGGGPMLTDLIAGNIMAAFTSSGSAQGHLRASRIRALGVTNARRTIALPDVPTISEAGVPGYEYGGWYGLFGPRGLPTEITEVINSMARRLMTQQPLRARLEELGGDLDLLGPTEFAATLNMENERWARAAAEGIIQRE